MAKEATCDASGLGPRKASVDATPKAKMGAAVVQGAAVFAPSKTFARFALLMLLPAHVHSQTAITNVNIATAVTAWTPDPTTVTTTYSNIGDWSTASALLMFNVCSLPLHAHGLYRPRRPI